MSDEKTINLSCFNIKIRINNGTGTISSDLHEKLSDGCMDGEEEKQVEKYNTCINTLESLVLSHAIAGVDVESFAYLEGVETSVGAILNNLP